jgi:hypothetical protein
MRYLSIFLLVYCLVCGVRAMDSNFISAADSSIQYFGRFDFTDRQEPQFDWPGVYIQVQFEGTSCSAVLKGRNCYDVLIDGDFHATVQVGHEKDTVVLAERLSRKNHLLQIVKRTESNSEVSTFSGFVLDKRGKIKNPLILPQRKIEFIGDSYTAGYANESVSRECTAEKYDTIIFSSTNTRKAFGPLISNMFGAQYQVNAYSGKGLVRNYNGVDKGKELLAYYDKTLQSRVNTHEVPPLWNFQSWHPDVVVVGIGINDFQADPPYSDSVQFDSTYTAFIDFLRTSHPGIKIICCATKVWPSNTLIPRVKKIVDDQVFCGANDIWYFEFESENTALYGHPSLTDHRKIACELSVLIASITGWNLKKE